MKRSKFSLSHYKLLSLKMGDLVPMGLIEVLPGDTVQHATNMLLRVSPLVSPVMHPCHARIHHWFVPHRLVWDKWEDFITGGPDGMDASVFPTVKMSYTAGSPDTGTGIVGGLGDYLGVTPKINNLEVSALPFRGYALIWNEWYRDQDLQTPLVISKASGLDTTTNMLLQKVAWEKDYYTSSRPWTQKGPEVTLPLAGTAPITGIGMATSGGVAPTANLGVTETDGTSATYPYSYPSNQANTMRIKAFDSSVQSRPQIFADLNNVTATSINDLRLAFALQRYEEARARYGSRYTEYLRYLGVRSSDARLQRPEYLGGGKETVQFSEVLQTGVTTSGNTGGVGNLKGHGIAGVRSNRYRRFFEEHGYVFSFVSVKPRTIYAQGLERTWLRRVKEDFWQRELQHIGQQPIDRRELYAASTNPDPFGYQDRFDEYRRQESKVLGQFRTTLLDYWHMARIFASEPELNADFVQSNPTNRIFADQTGNDTLYIMASHSIQARRMVSRTGASFIF